MLRDCLSVLARQGGRRILTARRARAHRKPRRQLVATTCDSPEPDHCEAFSPFASSYPLAVHPGTLSSSSRIRHRICDASTQTYPGPNLHQVRVPGFERDPAVIDPAGLENRIRSAPGIAPIEPLAVVVSVGCAIRARLSVDGLHHETRAGGRATSIHHRSGHLRVATREAGAAGIDDRLGAGGQQSIGQILIAGILFGNRVVPRDAVCVATRTRITRRPLAVHPRRGHVDAASILGQSGNHAADGTALSVGIRQGAPAPESPMPKAYLAPDGKSPQRGPWNRTNARPPRGQSDVSLQTRPLARMGHSSTSPCWRRSGRRSGDLPRPPQSRRPQVRSE